MRRVSAVLRVRGGRSDQPSFKQRAEQAEMGWSARRLSLQLCRQPWRGVAWGGAEGPAHTGVPAQMAQLRVSVELRDSWAQ